ncbi:MAG: hypothetical protein QFX37_06515 [Archaeoglobales archaeon]|nr:hypothetical protein [Archaeoglobales archaeon]
MRMLIGATIVLILMHTAIALETLTPANFSIDIKISPEKDHFFAGDTIQVNYIISPKTSSEKLKIGGEQGNPRSYYFRTTLLNPSWTLEIKYAGVSGVKQDFEDPSITIEVKYYSISEEGREGVDYISANLTGKVPDTALRLSEISILIARAEEATSDALKDVKIKVVNKTAFNIALNSLKQKLSEIRSKLDAEGVKYDEKDFQNVENLLSSGEKDFNAGDYGSADEKLKNAEDVLSKLTSLADKLRAEEIYKKLSDIASNATLKLNELEILIQALRGTENFKNLSSRYASLKATNEDLKTSLRSIKDYIDQEKFTKAYEEIKKIESAVYKLKDDVENLANEVSSTKENGGFDIISTLRAYSGYLIAVFLIILLAFTINFIIRFKKRRKWDELK